MQIYYYSEICKNYFKILGGGGKDWNDMTVDMTQRECSNIKHYASASSNI